MKRQNMPHRKAARRVRANERAQAFAKLSPAEQDRRRGYRVRVVEGHRVRERLSKEPT